MYNNITLFLVEFLNRICATKNYQGNHVLKLDPKDNPRNLTMDCFELEFRYQGKQIPGIPYVEPFDNFEISTKLSKHNTSNSSRTNISNYLLAILFAVGLTLKISTEAIFL